MSEEAPPPPRPKPPEPRFAPATGRPDTDPKQNDDVQQGGKDKGKKKRR